MSDTVISSLVFAELVGKLSSPATTAQLVALTYVQDNPECTIKRLATGIRVNHSAASQLVHKLSGDRLIQVEVHPTDRRHARLRISPAGSQTLQASRRQRLDALNRILDQMSEDERRVLTQGLQAFLKHALNSEEKADDACGRCWVEHFGDCVVNLVHRQLTGKETKRVPTPA